MIQTESGTSMGALRLAPQTWTHWVTNTKPLGVCLIFTLPQPPAEKEGSFDRHFDKQPSLDEVTARLRAKHPDFDVHLAEARQERWHLLQQEVEAGRLSRLAALRIQRGLTQSELGELTGMQQANVSRLENERTTMSVKTAKRLAKALNVADYRELLP